MDRRAFISTAAAAVTGAGAAGGEGEAAVLPVVDTPSSGAHALPGQGRGGTANGEARS